MAAWGYGFCVFVLKLKYLSLEDKIRITARPCNILYISGFKEMAFSGLYRRARPAKLTNHSARTN